MNILALVGIVAAVYLFIWGDELISIKWDKGKKKKKNGKKRF